jgi:hypothetical protein
MWRRVDIVLTDDSEERIASIFRVEEKGKPASEEPAWAGADSALLSTDFPSSPSSCSYTAGFIRLDISFSAFADLEAVPTENTVSNSIHSMVCLPIRFLETGSSLIACMLIFTSVCLPSHYLEMNNSGFQASCHIIGNTDNM